MILIYRNWNVLSAWETVHSHEKAIDNIYDLWLKYKLE